MSNIAMTHPSHMDGANFIAAIQAGFVHPFLGVDHMMLAIGMGMLMLRYHRSKTGLMSLLVGLILGFLLAVYGGLDQVAILESSVEIGITVSVMVVAMALFSKKIATSQHKLLQELAPFSLMILAIFHGVAHGIEVPDKLQMRGFFMGMIGSMSLLFVMGTAILQVIKKYGQDKLYYQRIVAGVGLVSVILS